MANEEDRRLIQDVLAGGRVYIGADADREMARVANEMADRRGRVDNAGHVVVDGTTNGTPTGTASTFGYTDIGYVSGDAFAAPPDADAGEPFISAEQWNRALRFEMPIRFTYVSGDVARFVRNLDV